MTVQKRMSPFTALFLGIFGLGAVSITVSSVVVLYGMRVVNVRAATLLGFAADTVEGLPELIESLPPAVGDVLSQRRAPDYAAKIGVDAALVADRSSSSVRPVLTITNEGDKMITLLAVRVAALNVDGVPLREWTEVVATPIAAGGPWRGPIMPDATRHVVLHQGSRGLLTGAPDAVTVAVEVSDVFVWMPVEDYASTSGVR